MVSLILAGISCICSGAAAYCWYRSASVEPMPTWDDSKGLDPMNEPMIKIFSPGGWISGTVKSISDSARWNKLGAIWSALAVVCTGLSSATDALGF